MSVRNQKQNENAKTKTRLTLEFGQTATATEVESEHGLPAVSWLMEKAKTVHKAVFIAFSVPGRRGPWCRGACVTPGVQLARSDRQGRCLHDTTTTLDFMLVSEPGADLLKTRREHGVSSEKKYQNVHAPRSPGTAPPPCFSLIDLHSEERMKCNLRGPLQCCNTSFFVSIVLCWLQKHGCLSHLFLENSMDSDSFSYMLMCRVPYGYIQEGKSNKIASHLISFFSPKSHGTHAVCL